MIEFFTTLIMVVVWAAVLLVPAVGFILIIGVIVASLLWGVDQIIGED